MSTPHDYPDPHDPETLEMIVDEIINPQDIYEAAPGPNGPWFYRSLFIRRQMNKIFIDDVDGDRYATRHIPDLSTDETTDDPEAALRAELDRLNTESLEEL